MTVLTVPAHTVQPFDSVVEGMAVIAIHHSQVEVWSLVLGVVRKWVVDIESVPARTVVAETLPTGEHLHDIDRSKVESQRFLADHELRVVRPAPIEPCACGV